MLKDPVTELVYPDLWVARCEDPNELRMVADGLAILTSQGKILKRGFTTGTTAAAACKAAVLSLAHDVSSVKIRTPSGVVLDVPAEGASGVAIAAKRPGDHPADLTAGARFRAVASPKGNGVDLKAGKGIGRFVRDTERYRTGRSRDIPVRDGLYHRLCHGGDARAGPRRDLHRTGGPGR